jgi:hypothetical protein
MEQQVQQDHQVLLVLLDRQVQQGQQVLQDLKVQLET